MVTGWHHLQLVHDLIDAPAWELEGTPPLPGHRCNHPGCPASRALHRTIQGQLLHNVNREITINIVW